MQLEVFQAHPHPIRRALGQRTIRREELELIGQPPILVEDLDRPYPLLLLAVVDLAEIENGMLDDPAAFAATAFHQ